MVSGVWGACGSRRCLVIACGGLDGVDGVDTRAAGGLAVAGAASRGADGWTLMGADTGRGRFVGIWMGRAGVTL